MKLDQKDIERFWSKVNKKSEDECWFWSDNSTDRYGRFWSKYHGSLGAHVVSYFIEFGDDSMENGNHIHHTCENSRCVNPKHLIKLTARDHMLVGDSFPAVQARQTHCKRGHKFTPENTYVYNGMRHCRTCHRMHQLNYTGGGG